ncbi:protein-glutamate O-methyltransferase CheR [uncultured Brevundimonas sp.]|uniref:CheR family methyltransferase n=1 Tax=uncultured Brevundimonas sp. TaxID=213418 RepID=UPI0030ED3838|tara:strand:+ start:5600 stop:6433 length:834 start_codon:yes stop_codon:yes gene_type:complete
MTDPDYDNFCRLARERSGLVLTPAKAYLVSGRLEPVARAEKLAGVPELLARLRSGAPEALIQRCIDAMATHESYFFRDGTPFEQLTTSVLPTLIAARQNTRSLRIWCAACSSGQEPYSIAMILQEMGARLAGWKIEIIATDMSEPVLTKARSGIYNEFEVKRGLSPERLARWFKPQGTGWQVSPVLQQMVQFRSHNLLKGTTGMGVLDVIFCRNVLIYFDVDHKRQILEQLHRAMANDGSLFLGSAETVMGLSQTIEPVTGMRGLYRRSQVGVARVA